LLSLKALHGLYSGENIATLLVQIIKDYNLQTRLGFYVLDNARDNDTSLLAISQYLATISVNWSGPNYRLCCFSYIVSLIAIAFTANKPLYLLKTSKTRRLIGALKPLKVAYKRLVDAITKIYKIIVYILVTS